MHIISNFLLSLYFQVNFFESKNKPVMDDTIRTYWDFTGIIHRCEKLFNNRSMMYRTYELCFEFFFLHCEKLKLINKTNGAKIIKRAKQ